MSPINYERKARMMNPNGHVVVTGWTLPDTPTAMGVLQPSEREDFRVPSGEYGMVEHANAGRHNIIACDTCGRTDALCSDCENAVADSIRHG